MNYFDNKTMTELCLLDSADVKHDRCPVCRKKNLDKLDGFKLCPRCNTMFKILNGKTYMINSQEIYKETILPNHYTDAPQGEMISVNNRIIKRMKLADHLDILSELVVKVSDIVNEEFANENVSIEDVSEIFDELLENIVQSEKDCLKEYGLGDNYRTTQNYKVIKMVFNNMFNMLLDSLEGDMTPEERRNVVRFAFKYNLDGFKRLLIEYIK